jgi:hypothetical protein
MGRGRERRGSRGRRWGGRVKSEDITELLGVPVV